MKLLRLIPLFLLGILIASAQTPAAAAEPAPAAPAKKAAEPEVAPREHEGAETFIYRDTSPEPLRIFVIKPKGWKASDRRPAFMFFFGGGWTTGTTKNSIGWAKWAADLGMVGIIPDYRTKNRFGTSPLFSVADSRAALRWAQDHAAELGIDPAKVTVGGSSAGGHVALWTGITATPPGSSATEAPLKKAAALVLFSAVSDTSEKTGYTPKRFGEHTTALSPVHQLDAQMPPVLAFHGDADPIVPMAQSVALRDKLTATGNVCELVVVPGGNHNFSGQFPEWREKSRKLIEAFLTQQGLLR
jgi:acetyl esterase/lipase